MPRKVSHARMSTPSGLMPKRDRGPGDEDGSAEPDAKRHRQAAVNGAGRRTPAHSSGDDGDGSPAEGGSRDSTPGPGPSGLQLAREDSFAGTGASGDLAGLRGAAGAVDGRKRSRKASAPRRAAAGDAELERMLKADTAASEARKVRSLAEKRAEEARQLMLSGKRDRKPSAKVLDGDGLEIEDVDPRRRAGSAAASGGRGRRGASLGSDPFLEEEDWGDRASSPGGIPEDEAAWWGAGSGDEAGVDDAAAQPAAKPAGRRVSKRTAAAARPRPWWEEEEDGEDADGEATDAAAGRKRGGRPPKQAKAAAPPAAKHWWESDDEEEAAGSGADGSGAAAAAKKAGKGLPDPAAGLAPAGSVAASPAGGEILDPDADGQPLSAAQQAVAAMLADAGRRPAGPPGGRGRGRGRPGSGGRGAAAGGAPAPGARPQRSKRAPKRAAEAVQDEAAEVSQRGGRSGGGGTDSGGARSPAPRSALSQALSQLGSAPPRGSLTAASLENTPSGPVPLHAGPSAKAGRVRSPTGFSPADPRPEPQAHPQLLTLPQPGSLPQGPAAGLSRQGRHATGQAPQPAAQAAAQQQGDQQQAPQQAAAPQGGVPAASSAPSPAPLSSLQQPKPQLLQQQAQPQQMQLQHTQQQHSQPQQQAAFAMQQMPMGLLLGGAPPGVQLTPEQLQQLQQLPNLANLPATLPPPGSAEAARLLQQLGQQLRDMGIPIPGGVPLALPPGMSPGALPPGLLPAGFPAASGISTISGVAASGAPAAAFPPQQAANGGAEGAEAGAKARPGAQKSRAKGDGGSLVDPARALSGESVQRVAKVMGLLADIRSKPAEPGAAGGRHSDAATPGAAPAATAGAAAASQAPATAQPPVTPPPQPAASVAEPIQVNGGLTPQTHELLGLGSPLLTSQDLADLFDPANAIGATPTSTQQLAAASSADPVPGMAPAAAQQAPSAPEAAQLAASAQLPADSAAPQQMTAAQFLAGLPPQHQLQHQLQMQGSGGLQLPPTQLPPQPPPQWQQPASLPPMPMSAPVPVPPPAQMQQRRAPAGGRDRDRSPAGRGQLSVAAAAPRPSGGDPGPPSRSSRYRGVTKHRRSGRWEAHIWVKELGRQVYLGGYEHEEHAAEAYDVAALKCKGPRVKTNFTISRYADLTECMDSISLEELIMAVRRQSQGFSRGTSAFRGVTHHPSGRWEARIGIPGSKHIYLGLFNEEREAARMYDAALVRLRGTAAATNFALSDYRADLAEYHKMQQLLAGAPQAVMDADAGNSGGIGGAHPGANPGVNPSGGGGGSTQTPTNADAAGLDGGAAFERWIKTGSWADDGCDPQQRALAIATAVVRAAGSNVAPGDGGADAGGRRTGHGAALAAAAHAAHGNRSGMPRGNVPRPTAQAPGARQGMPSLTPPAPGAAAANGSAGAAADPVAFANGAAAASGAPGAMAGMPVAAAMPDINVPNAGPAVVAVQQQAAAKHMAAIGAPPSDWPGAPQFAQGQQPQERPLSLQEQLRAPLDAPQQA